MAKNEQYWYNLGNSPHEFGKNMRRILEKRTENFLKHGVFLEFLGMFSTKIRREFLWGEIEYSLLQGDTFAK